MRMNNTQFFVLVLWQKLIMRSDSQFMGDDVFVLPEEGGLNGKCLPFSPSSGQHLWLVQQEETESRQGR